MNRFFEAFSQLLAAIFGGGSNTASTGTSTGTGTTGNAGPNGETGTTGAGGSTTVAAGGALQQKIVAEAAKLANKPFKYAADTNNGTKGCAQVVTTALKAAGAVTSIKLGVLDALNDKTRKAPEAISLRSFFLLTMSNTISKEHKRILDVGADLVSARSIAGGKQFRLDKNYA